MAKERSSSRSRISETKKRVRPDSRSRKPKSKPESKSRITSQSKGGVSNKVAPYSLHSQHTQSKLPSQSELSSVVRNVVKKLLNKSNSKVAVEKPRFGFASKNK